jgi:chitinase
LHASSIAQVSPNVPATTAKHSKQVIGYITQWDAWKEVANLVPKGGFNHLNVDYSQYTILNFSFFGVAKDGSLHSGDFRNKNIYQVGAVQEPAALLNEDIYSSWDLYLLYGELETLYYISDNSYAYQQGYRNEGAGWKNVNTGRTGNFPLAIHKQGGAPGLLELAHQKGVKVMASIGGWSMCKHYPEMAADASPPSASHWGSAARSRSLGCSRESSTASSRRTRRRSPPSRCCCWPSRRLPPSSPRAARRGWTR